MADPDGPLGSGELIAFVPTSDIDRARVFYEGVLGFPVLAQSPMACVLRAPATTLRVTLVNDLRPAPFTIVGWVVPDIVAAVIALVERGVELSRYAEMALDEHGIWTAPGGDRVAWFRDPDGNTLSVTELGQR